VTDFRRAKTLAEPRDDCGRCRHGQSQPYAGRALLMCRHEQRLRVFGRQQVAASVARADWCDGRMWERRA
jgi:hypothetical protein